MGYKHTARDVGFPRLSDFPTTARGVVALVHDDQDRALMPKARRFPAPGLSVYERCS
jgi:hypothetical protein